MHGLSKVIPPNVVCILYAKQKHIGCKKSKRSIRSSIANKYRIEGNFGGGKLWQIAGKMLLAK